jgi:hypothetical protein
MTDMQPVPAPAMHAFSLPVIRSQPARGWMEGVLGDFAGLGPFMGPVMEPLMGPLAFADYARDAWQRSVLFLDILRRRGNQRDQMTARGADSVLSYDTEVVMRGDSLPHPVNYTLLKVLPSTDVEIDDRKRPVVVIDPRAGQGPGIGGFKHVSEVGDALAAGHPVYFIGFAAEPIDGQRVEDVARAFTLFLDKVTELHPGALGKPFVFGNCQAGWHALIAACLRPDAAGGVLVAGAPLSYWAGLRGRNPMRYNGGLLGGTWLSRLVSDLGNGTFDGAWLIANFDNLNPANTLWAKQYAVWSDPEKEQQRYLDFEKWWGDFIVLRGDELQWMVDQLFVGNRLSTGQIVTSDGTRLDLREIKAPIVCFCSQGDNITPPQQALDWILDNYTSVDEIRRHSQRIFYAVDPKVGHLAIFVSTRVAAKDHAEFVSNIEFFEAMPPGLYEIVIDERDTGDEAEELVPGYRLRIEARELDDIRALGCNSAEDEREFAAVSRLSQVNNALYETWLQPGVKAMTSPQMARAFVELHPLRLGYAMFSDRNPLMAPLAALAEQVHTDRRPCAAGNPFMAAQQQVSQAMVDGLNAWRDLRDHWAEQMFHAFYGSPAVQAACGIGSADGPPRPRPGHSPTLEAAIDRRIRQLKEQLSAGGSLAALARALLYVARAVHTVDEHTFAAIRRLLQIHPQVTPDAFRSMLAEQWAIVHLGEKDALDSLPRLLPADAEDRRKLLEILRTVIATLGTLDSDGRHRLAAVERQFEDDHPAAHPATRMTL